MPSVYDTYLCREPANDVPMLIRNGPDEYTALLRILQRSADYFAEKDHTRTVERLQLEIARVHMQNKRWDRAARVLISLSQTLSWRRAGWWVLLEEMDWALRDCARRIGDLQTLIAVEWELMCSYLTPRQDWHYDFSKAIDGIKTSNPRPKSVIRAESTLSCISATFAFGVTEGNVGVSLPSQLIVTSRTHKDSTPILVSQVKVAFEGGLRSFNIQHELTEKPEASTSDGLAHLHRISLQKASSDATSLPSSPNFSPGSQPLIRVADLEIAPGVTKALSLDHVPRDPGDVEVASITLCMSVVDFDMEVVITEQEQIHQETLWVKSPLGLLPKKAKVGRSSVVKILPKPPKMQIQALGLSPNYFTDEDITIEIEATNEEEEETNVSIDARLLAPSGILPTLRWALDEGEDSREVAPEDPPDPSSIDSSSKSIGNLAPMANRRHTLCIQGSPVAADYILEVKARYHVLSDPETPIIKSFSTKIGVVTPFKANHSFLPRIHCEPWPSYFNADGLDENSKNDAGEMEVAKGLTQEWSLTSRIASLANVSLMIQSVEPQVVEIHEGAICSISSASGDTVAASMISPNDFQAHDFVILAQKLDLEDRRSTFLDLRLEIKWHRDGFQGPPVVTHLSVPELVIPFGEPRVLASARSGNVPPGAINLDYVIENPSMYALPFQLTMDISEEFAFSGPKNVTLQLVPLSRHNIRYVILPHVKGLWISPQFRVFDTHFQKSLKVNATEGMRSDKKGVSIWVDADS
ncbi:hypothetical protein HO133_002715 [Letharia lupina]|uniref:Trafficking protein particle complex subunit 11 n=1 Tax=Letharia lupina TaxID=560253 RepID=A0A8H6CD33_9LECA|nr:uncharacterized protein HO133_002715 [Letharia lupina]KAF6221034.1 hypothetical protein HO133_002715 [Letharia lupina]